eukprot:m.179100 g.179100  ORF g.179100 m.179100 type:complete len:938 (+) comp13565_c0_seq5:334-3147(+)
MPPQQPPLPGCWGYMCPNTSAEGEIIHLWVIDKNGVKRSEKVDILGNGLFSWSKQAWRDLHSIACRFGETLGVDCAGQRCPLLAELCPVCSRWCFEDEYAAHCRQCYERMILSSSSPQTVSSSTTPPIPTNNATCKSSTSSTSSTSTPHLSSTLSISSTTSTTAHGNDFMKGNERYKYSIDNSNSNKSSNNNVSKLYFGSNNPFNGHEEGGCDKRKDNIPNISIYNEDDNVFGENSNIHDSNAAYHNSISSRPNPSLSSSSHSTTAYLQKQHSSDMRLCDSEEEDLTSTTTSAITTSTAQTPQRLQISPQTSTSSSQSMQLCPNCIEPNTSLLCSRCYVHSDVGSSVYVEFSSSEHKSSYESSKDELFEDMQFKHDKSSIGSSIYGDVEWKRLSDMDNFGELVVFKSECARDIVQGQLGNCWLMSALAVVATRTEMRQIVLSETISHNGSYLVRLCKDGKWVVVEVDDYFPVDATGSLIFSPIRNNQIWVPLVEKAMAKLYGSYHALTDGNMSEGFLLLTGNPCVSVTPLMNEEKNNWTEVNSYFDADYLLGATIEEMEKDEEEQYAQVGLTTAHAYSVLDMKVVGIQQFVRLRNPTAQLEWNGDWSNHDDRNYTQTMLSALKPTDNEDGEFWMCWKDVCNYFTVIEIGKRFPYCMRMYGRFANTTCSETSAFSVTIKENTEIDVSVHCTDTRGNDGSQSLIPQDIGIAIFSGVENGNGTLCAGECICVQERQYAHTVLFQSPVLDKGIYVVLPFSFQKLNRSNGDSGERPLYVLTIHSTQGVEAAKIEYASKQWSSCVCKLVRRFGNIMCSNDTMAVFKYDGMTVAENRDTQLHLVFDCKLLRLNNYLTSRGRSDSNNNVDIKCITSPRCQQLVVVLSKIVGDEDSACSIHKVLSVASTAQGINIQKENVPHIHSVDDIHHQQYVVATSDTITNTI